MLSKTVTNILKVARYRLYESTTSTKLSDTDGIFWANIVILNLIVKIMNACGDWQVKGDYGTADIKAGSNEISWPSDLIKLDRVEFKYPSNANVYLPATQIDHKTINRQGMDNYVPPTFQYDLFGDVMLIYVTDKKSDIQGVSEGVKAWFQVLHAELTAVSSTVNITYPQTIELMGKMIAEEVAKAKGRKSMASEINAEVKELIEGDLKEYYANKSEGKRLQLRPRREDYGQKSLRNRSVGREAVTYSSN